MKPLTVKIECYPRMMKAIANYIGKRTVSREDAQLLLQRMLMSDIDCLLSDLDYEEERCKKSVKINRGEK